jgi:hypothetical protein
MRRLFLICFVCVGVQISGALLVRAQDGQHALYASGTYPAGHYYRERDLASLVDQPLPDHAYLIGEYLYLGATNGGLQTFAPFQVDPNSNQLTFGAKTLIAVKFYDNFPPSLSIGKAIEPTAADPLVLRGVRRSSEGFLLVVAECLSAP